ncbi:MAG: hypothetical protein SH857_17670 [Chitinophagales bacterium]|nr:hypothetical protein [Chitinophagales bacterium]
MKLLAGKRLYCSFLLAAFLLLQVRVAYSCDACSSNMGSFYPGVADYGNSFVSFTSTVRTYGVYIPSGYRWMTSGNQNGGHQHPVFEKSAYYDQSHIAHELRFSYSMKNVTLGVFLPLMQKKLFRNEELVENNIGLGDMRFTVLYRAVNRKNATGAVTNRFFAGTGFSIPTGESGETGYDGMIEPSRQTGAGTISFLLNAAYQLNVKKFGAQAQSVFQTFDADSKGYRFGNAYNFSMRAYYELEAGKLMLTPSIGINLEVAGKDKLNGAYYSLDTGGKRVFCPAGIDVYWKPIGISFTWNLPVSEQLNGLQFEGKQFFTAGLRYVFKKT